MNKTSILSQSAWWVVNKAVSKKLGIETAVYLADLVSKYEYFENRNQLDSDGYFFNEKKNIEFDTTLTPYKQDLALEKLVELEIIHTKKAGIPPKLFYKINFKKLNAFISKLHN